MTSITEKVEHVLGACDHDFQPYGEPGTRGEGILRCSKCFLLQRGTPRQHHCHWPGCDQQVPPAKWGCKKHWFRLPESIRRNIWRCYRPGQEDDGKPSTAYVQVAAEAREFALEWEKRNAPAPKLL